MKRLTLLSSILFLILNAYGATNITTPTVSGSWTLAGSPYLIFNDIKVAKCTSLMIEPGVEVIFQGHYSFIVDGDLNAVGTATQLIRFHINDTTGFSDTTNLNGGWKGMWYNQNTCPSGNPSAFDYCDISDVKNSSIFGAYHRNLSFSYCNFHHCMGTLGMGLDSLGYCEMAFCSIYDITNLIVQPAGVGVRNVIASIGPKMWDTSSLWYIHDCKIYDNQSAISICRFLNCKVRFENNEVYNNQMSDFTPNATIEVTQCNGILKGNKVHHNTSNFDGAISCRLSNVTVENNLICNNNILMSYSGSGVMCLAVQGGGAIRLDDQGYPNHTYIIRNNILANNYTGTAGGAIFIIDASANIVNNQVVNNIAAWHGGGVAVCNTSSVKSTSIKIKNNLLFNNVSYVGSDTSDLFLLGADSIEFSHNYLKRPFNKSVKLYGSPAYTLIGDTLKNHVNANHGMIAPTINPDVTESALSANFGLLNTSPCINRGDAVNSFLSSIDYIGNNRTVGGKVDIGAYENQFVVWAQNALLEKKMSAYPNPVTNILFIATPKAEGTIQLQDISGKLFAETEVTNTLTPFDVHAMPRGIYFAIWHDGSGTKATQKIIVE